MSNTYDAGGLFVSIHQLITCDKNMERGILVVANFLFAPKLSQSCTILDIPPVG